MRQIVRNKDYHVIPDAVNSFSDHVVLSVYRKMTRARCFENSIVNVAKSGKIQVKVHMSSGQEAVSAAITEVANDYQMFIQHRSMDTYLSLNGDPYKLRDEMLGLDTGCCGGKLGGAFQIHENGIDMYAHTGFIGENVSVGVGMALGNGRKTLCLFGDGAAEEDYVLEAIGFAATHKLPVLFICTDNELSVLSSKEKRRSWEISDVSNAFGITSIDVSDDPFTLMKRIQEFDKNLPALINVRVCRNYWHAGVGIDSAPEWDRYFIVQKQLKDRGLSKQMDRIDCEEAAKMEDVWKTYL